MAKREHRAKWYMGAALMAAAAVSVALKPAGLGAVKGAGAALAVAAVLPVFILLRRALASGSSKRLLGTFVGGFLFKLVLVLAGVWWAVAKARWGVAQFVVPCLAFLVALQFCEAIFFWVAKSEPETGIEEGQLTAPNASDGGT